jgi:hypothetical protein
MIGAVGDGIEVVVAKEIETLVPRVIQINII